MIFARWRIARTIEGRRHYLVRNAGCSHWAKDADAGTLFGVNAFAIARKFGGIVERDRDTLVLGDNGSFTKARDRD